MYIQTDILSYLMGAISENDLLEIAGEFDLDCANNFMRHIDRPIVFKFAQDAEFEQPTYEAICNVTGQFADCYNVHVYELLRVTAQNEPILGEQIAINGKL